MALGCHTSMFKRVTTHGVSSAGSCWREMTRGGSGGSSVSGEFEGVKKQSTAECCSSASQVPALLLRDCHRHSSSLGTRHSAAAGDAEASQSRVGLNPAQHFFTNKSDSGLLDLAERTVTLTLQSL
jgi:hypothetical protein